MQIDKDTNIGVLLDNHRSCAEVLMMAGMPCLGCPSARAETIAQACGVHGIDIDTLLTQLRERIAAE